jgi:hypothetical protein
MNVKNCVERDQLAFAVLPLCSFARRISPTKHEHTDTVHRLTTTVTFPAATFAAILLLVAIAAIAEHAHAQYCVPLPAPGGHVINLEEIGVLSGVLASDCRSAHRR